MNSFKWLLSIASKYPFRSIYIIIMPIIEIFLYLYPVSITADIIQQILDNNLENLVETLVFLFFFAIFQAAIYFSLNFVNETLAHRITTDITQELFETVQEKSLRYHDTKDIGQIMSRATGDTRTINKALSPGVVRFIALLTIWVLAFIISYLINGWLLIITFFSFLFYIYTLYIYAKNRIDISNQVLVEFANLTENSLKSVSGIKEIKNFTAEPLTSSSFNQRNSSHIQALTREGEKSAWFYPALVATFYATGMISLSVYFTFIEVISFENVVLIAGVILFLRSFSANQNWTARQIIAAIAATRRVYNLIYEADPVNFADGKMNLENKEASIEFRDVSFRYQDNLPLALKNINFKIEQNQTIAIVGTPGSGKSTLTKLIQRLYLPSEGKILIGEVPIEKYDNEALRKFISTVEQDIFLFNKSIIENIRFGKPDASKSEIIEVAKLAQAHKFITQFPKGYDTVIGEKGVRLSGGQAQRLSIARALLVNPSILLMDDGASALDAKTEIEIQKAISDILQTRTTVITTHRLSIIAKSDLIIILDSGELVGKGSHSELIRNNPHYRKLFEYHYELPKMEGQ